MTWLLVSLHPGHEIKAVSHLTRQGYDVYCPMIERRRSHARKIEIVRRALFPGYLFLQNHQEKDISLRPVRSTVGVRDFVRFGLSPAQVPEQIVESFKMREIDGAIPARLLSETLPTGTAVRVLAGAFKDMVATVLSCDAQDRVLLLLDFLQRQVKVRVIADALEKC